MPLPVSAGGGLIGLILFLIPPAEASRSTDGGWRWKGINHHECRRLPKRQGGEVMKICDEIGRVELDRRAESEAGGRKAMVVFFFQ